MSTELARIGPISSPAQLPSLPESLKLRIDGLVREPYPDTHGKTLMVLPAEQIPTSSERIMIEKHVASLNKFLGLKEKIVLRDQTLTNDQAYGVLIAGLLIKGSGAKLDKASADALTEDYLDAFEGLPAWAIREAIRKWNRGESRPVNGKPHDFAWRPVPATLRQLAELELVPVKLRILRLGELLEAVPRIEFTEEHCAEMRQRLKGLTDYHQHHPLDDPTPQRQEAS